MRAPLLGVSEVEQQLAEAVRTRAPFSLLRIGDAEGALLDYGDASSDEDTKFLAAHFGPSTSRQELYTARDLVDEALRGCDIVGIRDDVWNTDPAAKELTGTEPDFLSRYKATLPLRPVEEPDIEDHALRRLFGAYRWNLRALGDKPAASAWIAYDLALAGSIARILRSLKSVLLVNASPTLPRKVERALGLRVEHLRIADRWVDTDQKNDHLFPAEYDRLAKALDRQLEGKVVIMGVGLLGKALGTVVRRRGGIALDLGGLLDAWDGRATRPLVYATKVGDAGIAPFALRPLPLPRLVASRFRRAVGV